MKLCVNCKHYSKNNVMYSDMCIRALETAIDLVTGKLRFSYPKEGHMIWDCYNQRYHEQFCGESGKYYEERKHE